MIAETSGFTKVVILGASAIGSYCGSMLSKKTGVLLVGRWGHVDAVNSLGLEVTGAVEETFDLNASTELSARSHMRVGLISIEEITV